MGREETDPESTPWSNSCRKPWVSHLQQTNLPTLWALASQDPHTSPHPPKSPLPLKSSIKQYPLSCDPYTQCHFLKSCFQHTFCLTFLHITSGSTHVHTFSPRTLHTLAHMLFLTLSINMEHFSVPVHLKLYREEMPVPVKNKNHLIFPNLYDFA